MRLLASAKKVYPAAMKRAALGDASMPEAVQDGDRNSASSNTNAAGSGHADFPHAVAIENGDAKLPEVIEVGDGVTKLAT